MIGAHLLHAHRELLGRGGQSASERAKRAGNSQIAQHFHAKETKLFHFTEASSWCSLVHKDDLYLWLELGLLVQEKIRRLSCHVVASVKNQPMPTVFIGILNSRPQRQPTQRALGTGSLHRRHSRGAAPSSTCHCCR